MERQYERTRRNRLIRGAIISVSTLWGAVAGLLLSMGIVVTESRFGIYIFAAEDLATFRWDTLPIPLGAVLGLVLGATRPGAVDRATLHGLAGLAIGVVAGALIGPHVLGAGPGAWAGAIIGGAAGLLAGGLTSIRGGRRTPARLGAGATGTIFLLVPALVASIVMSNFPSTDPVDDIVTVTMTAPDPADVDAVVFLLGDAGETVAGRSPLLPVLRDDIERWSADLAQDSAVSLIFLGDIVYPAGVRNRGDPGFAADSVRLWNEIRLVAGPEATRHSTAGWFVTGNHDWGNASGESGLRRVLNLAGQLDSARASGLEVSLLPSGGEAGPASRDARHNVRILFLDTHWFLQVRSAAERLAFIDRVEAALRGAGEREVIMVAHHPFRSAGPHGAILPGHHYGGVGYLLREAGALVQDINSPAYEALRAGLVDAFRSAGRTPLVFAGGHDHSLQVLERQSEDEPAWSLVSGAGSDLTSIRHMPGLVWGAARPGYMKLLFRKDGGVDLFVTAGNEDDHLCAETDADACMRRALAAFRVVFAATLLPPSQSQAGEQRTR